MARDGAEVEQSQVPLVVHEQRLTHCRIEVGGHVGIDPKQLRRGAAGRWVDKQDLQRLGAGVAESRGCPDLALPPFTIGASLPSASSRGPSPNRKNCRSPIGCQCNSAPGAIVMMPPYMSAPASRSSTNILDLGRARELFRGREVPRARTRWCACRLTVVHLIPPICHES